MDATHHLPDGRLVRLRLPQASDRDGIADLHARLGVHVDELDVARALRFDPRHELVVCATTWVSDQEAVVGWMIAARGSERARFAIADDELAPGVRDVLAEALARHARLAA